MDFDDLKLDWESDESRDGPERLSQEASSTMKIAHSKQRATERSEGSGLETAEESHSGKSEVCGNSKSNNVAYQTQQRSKLRRAETAKSPYNEY